MSTDYEVYRGLIERLRGQIAELKNRARQGVNVASEMSRLSARCRELKSELGKLAKRMNRK